MQIKKEGDNRVVIESIQFFDHHNWALNISDILLKYLGLSMV